MTTEPPTPDAAGTAGAPVTASPPTTTGVEASPEPAPAPPADPAAPLEPPPPPGPPAPPAPPPAAPPPAATTDELARLVASKHAELSAKGFSDGVVNAALKRSMAMATELGDALSPEIREQGTLDLLRASLVDTEEWCSNYTASLSK
jgi:hypothetical protein